MTFRIVCIVLMVIGIVICFVKEKNGWKPNKTWNFLEGMLWMVIAICASEILRESLHLENDILDFFIILLIMSVIMLFRQFVRQMTKIPDRWIFNN